MSKKVIAFRENISVPGEPFADLVEVLENMLELAKSGEIVGLAYVTARRDSLAATGWTGDAGTRNTLATGILCLHHRYAESLLDDSNSS